MVPKFICSNTTFMLVLMNSMEALEFIGLHWRLILMEMRKRILCAVMVSIIVRIDGLGLQSRNGIKFLDCRSTKPGKCSKNCALNFSNLCILNSIFLYFARFNLCVAERD